MHIPLFSQAKRAPVPLMQMESGPSVKRVAANESPRRTPGRPASETTGLQSVGNANRGLELGLELGVLGRRQETKSDFLGMQAFYGGRVLTHFSIAESISLRPSLGGFFKKESTGSVSVTQIHLEGGVAAYYSLLANESLTWDLGVSQRLQWTTSRISVYDASDNTPGQFYYRVGPATALGFGISSKMKFILGYEYTWTLSSPARGYSYTAGGVLFKL